MGILLLTVPRLEVQAKVCSTMLILQTSREGPSHPFPACGVLGSPWCSLSCCGVFGVCLHHPMTVFSVCPCVQNTFFPWDHYSIDSGHHPLSFFSGCVHKAPWQSQLKGEKGLFELTLQGIWVQAQGTWSSWSCPIHKQSTTDASAARFLFFI